MSNATSGERNQTLDIAKGLGIVLVVLGHNPVFREGAHPLYEAVYLFHMPLFFFLSGVTFRVSPPGEALLKRARALLVPYFVMGVAALVVAFNAGGLNAIDDEFGGILYGTGHTLRFVPLWFLPCLFIVSMGATFLLNGARAAMGQPRYDARRTLILAVIAVAGLVAGSLILDSQIFAQAPYVDFKGRPLGLPWSLDLLPFALGLFAAGTLSARNPHLLRFPQPWVVMLATAGVLAAMVSINVSLDLNYRRMTHPLGALVAMMAGIALVLAASTLISRVRWASKLFAYLGSASLVIFMLHSPLQRRLLHPFLKRDVNEIVTVVATVVLTIAAIAVFDRRILRRVRAIGWVVYPRRDAARSPA